MALYAYMMIGCNTLSLLHDTWSLAKQISYFIRLMVEYPASLLFRYNAIQILIHNIIILFYFRKKILIIQQYYFDVLLRDRFQTKN